MGGMTEDPRIALTSSSTPCLRGRWFGRVWAHGPLFTVRYEFHMIRPTHGSSPSPRSPCADKSHQERWFGRKETLDTLMKGKRGGTP